MITLTIALLSSAGTLAMLPAAMRSREDKRLYRLAQEEMDAWDPMATMPTFAAYNRWHKHSTRTLLIGIAGFAVAVAWSAAILALA